MVYAGDKEEEEKVNVKQHKFKEKIATHFSICKHFNVNGSVLFCFYILSCNESNFKLTKNNFFHSFQGEGGKEENRKFQCYV